MTITRRQMLVGAPLAALGAGSLTSWAQSSNNWLKGIDVSKWQQGINWMSVKNAGTVFAFCKASEGASYIDPYFTQNWPAMKIAGVLRGAYHYGHPNVDPTAQAEHFMRTVRPVKGDLPLVLDLESHDNKTKPQIWAWTQTFVNRIKAKMGRAPIIYTGFYFWKDEVGNPTNNLGCPLWLPNYGSSPANLIPAAWNSWTFWQYSSTGTIPGITGNCDRNYFNGSLSQLRALAY